VLSLAAKARIRLAIAAVALVPVALLARAVASGRLTEFVQRRWAQQWKRYDAAARKPAP